MKFKEKEDSVVKFNKNNIYCGKSDRGYGMTYFARRNFKKGEIVLKGFGRVVDHQTKHISIQLKHGAHFVPEKWNGRYLNHSCNPNLYVATRADGFPNWLAKRNISKGEEISYAYYMTEFDWHSVAHELAVICLCNARGCHKKIRAFFHLSHREKHILVKKGYVSSYLIKHHRSSLRK